jgi:hypothetical protein
MSIAWEKLNDLIERVDELEEQVIDIQEQMARCCGKGCCGQVQGEVSGPGLEDDE